MSKLPPLPEPLGEFLYLGRDQAWNERTGQFTADQVRALQVATWNAAIEAAAAKCEAERRLGLDDERAYYGDLMAEAVRKLKEPTNDQEG